MIEFEVDCFHNVKNLNISIDSINIEKDHMENSNSTISRNINPKHLEIVNCEFESNLCNYELILSKNVSLYERSQWFLKNGGVEGKSGYEITEKPGGFFFSSSLFLCEGRTPILESPMITIENVGHTFSFYHFLSGGVRNAIYATINGKVYYYFNRYWQGFLQSGYWKKAVLHLPIGTYKIRIELDCTTLWTHSVDLDSFAINRDPIPTISPKTTKTITPILKPTNKPKTLADYLELNAYDEKYIWTFQKRNSGVLTRPNSDVNGSGYYLYSGPGRCYSNYVAIHLYSQVVNVNQTGYRFSFYYYLENVKGMRISLRFGIKQVFVIDKDEHNRKNITSNKWNKIMLDLPIGKYYIKFSVYCSTVNSNGNFAIDSIVVDRASPATLMPSSTKQSESKVGLNYERCGLQSDSSYIIGGNPSRIEDIPWQIMLLQTYNGITTYSGAVLIHENYALTTASVVNNQYATYRILVGTDSFVGGKTYEISNIIKHPEFGQGLGNSIALLKLKSNVQMSQKISTACVLNTTLIGSESHNCYISGFGRLFPTEFRLPQLRKANQKLITKLQCNKKIPIVNLNYDKIMCSIGESGEQSCIGDLGGGLFCKRNNRWTLVGIQSNFIKGCKYGLTISQQVGSFYSWIEQMISNE
ncbi:DgyrCDS14558 [Dimorphilus gyrociliatus]|uniref:DgyrCDS14558 n=1 Tax=Dimorphilus gyrociliatus TaxID=2664684 RepID=A0A7I8WEA5_9ANNE|nr:DgyrCDS14558 [Dimorphilus gyrociliatus]